MKIVIKTLGCRANRYESDRIQDVFEPEGWYVRDLIQYKMHEADVILINTCTVTHAADRKSRQSLSPLIKRFPGAKTIIFGCGANVHKDEYENLPKVNYVVQKREDLYKLLKKLAKEFTETCAPLELVSNRNRSLIKIQDGCNNFCTYCIIPYSRGREKSVPLEEILKEIHEKISQGYKEIVLTGINIGMWKDGNKDLADLIETILKETDLPRLRLGSIEPQNYPKKFYELFKNDRFCPHLHVSLQSGSDEILKKMNRHYDTRLFKKMVGNLRKYAPEIGITTDIIVGFPGETDELFEETLKFAREINFSKIHIFPYSKRKGTVAASMQNQIPEKTKQIRCQKLAETEKEMRRGFYEKHIGKSQKVLVEAIGANGIAHGFTPNYIKVRINLAGSEIKPKDIIKVNLKSTGKEKFEMIGEL